MGFKQRGKNNFLRSQNGKKNKKKLQGEEKEITKQERISEIHFFFFGQKINKSKGINFFFFVLNFFFFFDIFVFLSLSVS